MRRKIKYLVFCLAIITCFLTILFIEPDKRFLFANATGDCSGRSTFMYNALYNNPTNADIAIFGSSRTMNGINDSLMNATGATKFFNLGYCRFGRNLDYFFIEEYCRLHRPSKIVLEVRGTEGDNTHAVTPFFISVPGIAEGLFTGNADVFKDLYNKWLCNLKFLRGRIFNNNLNINTSVNLSHGFWYGNTPENIAGVNEERFKDSISLSKEKHDYEKLNPNSKFYFEKLKTLAEEKKATLYFLYLPCYGKLYKKPAQEKDYLAYGQLLIPPDSIVCDPRNFSNYSHLNKRGADLISIWLKRALNQ